VTMLLLKAALCTAVSAVKGFLLTGHKSGKLPSP